MDLEIINVIKNAKNIVIAGHISPDADSIGACFAMAHALKNMGKQVWVIMDKYSDKYKILPGWDFVTQSDIDPDLFISVDCGDEARLGSAIPLFKSTKSLVIDHHINTGFGDYNYIDTNASSTCEMLFQVISDLTDITKDIAVCLYSGILTDTGGFRFKATSPKTMEVVSQLLHFDFDFNMIYEKLMFEQTLHQFHGFLSILNDYVYDKELDFVYVTATKEKMSGLGITRNDLDGIINFFNRIKEMKVAAFAYETDEGNTKVSLRSHSFDVNSIASFFGGGGHKLASGCEFDLTPDKAIEKIRDKLRELI